MLRATLQACKKYNLLSTNSLGAMHVRECHIERRAIQQDNNYEEFMSWITDGGLRYAVAKQNKDLAADAVYRKTVEPKHKRHVVVVGAGMSGLAAAYELSQIGHEVTILEAQSRVGGRVKTIREGFSDGLHCEGGAMRLPPNHYLTHHYLDLFNVKTRPFSNKNPRAYIKVYDNPPVRVEDFERNNKQYTDQWWPRWDANLSDALKKEMNITGILSLYDKTVEPVKRELGSNPTNEDWSSWIKKWSKLSLEEFLRSDIYQTENDPKLRPWTEEAIAAYKVSTYTPNTSAALTSFLREELGEWWQEPLTTPVAGMDSLPKAFAKKNENGWNKDVNLSKNTVHGAIVKKVEEIDGGGKGVRVSGTNMITGKEIVVEGDAVILTLPITILRQLDVPFSIEKQKALAQISYQSSTKIMLQCKKRFWQKDLGQGGFSRTNQQIGQLHYPDYPKSGIPDDERGILLVYTWDQNARTFGAEGEQMAIESVVHQISKIHPEIYDHFEVGRVQAWHSDPSAQGAFAGLHPFEYMDSFCTLVTPTDTIYLAGEALSWSNGWIQGAIFSGLTQAFCFEKLVETGKPVSPVNLLLKS